MIIKKNPNTQPPSTVFQAKIRKYLKLSTKPYITSHQAEKPENP